MFDYDKEEAQFLKELTDGKFNIERVPNTEVDYAKEKEERDVKAYADYLKSDSFKDLCTGKIGDE